MRKIHFFFLAFFVVPILLSIFIPHPLTFRQPNSSATLSAQLSSDNNPNTANAPTALPSATLSCLGESDIESMVGRKFELQRETYIPETSTLECSYLSPDLIHDISPSLSYVLRETTDNSWQEKKDVVIHKSSYRTIENKPDYFADVNPVFEINQAQFFAKDEKHYLELNYSPVQESSGELLHKGTAVLDKILGK
jgi:hypothetical protein